MQIGEIVTLFVDAAFGECSNSWSMDSEVFLRVLRVLSVLSVLRGEFLALVLEK